MGQYVPYTPEERQALEETARRLDGRADKYQRAANSVRMQLEQGRHILGNLPALPESSPDCYLCTFSFNRICSLGMHYGSVCRHYVNNKEARTHSTCGGFIHPRPGSQQASCTKCNEGGD